MEDRKDSACDRSAKAGQKRPRAAPQDEEVSVQCAETQSNRTNNSDPRQLTSHTLRLLKLVEEGTVEHAQLAARQLSEIVAGSPPVILWDILGRLQAYLTSPEWKTRQNASIAMEGVAQQLPEQDQQHFLQNTAAAIRSRQEMEETHHGWLTVEDINANLDTILEKGRCLLSMAESNYDQQEEEELERLDRSAGGESDFVQQRTQLQRRILARRLGLSAMLDRFSGNEVAESLLPVDEERNNSSSTQTQRRKKGKRNILDSDATTRSIRALLVMEVQRKQEDRPNSAFSRNVSHQNAQRLLATELVFRMFDSSWYVRHGSLLGIMALIRAWRLHEASCFGQWPEDIMSRCLCTLGLDRFADYSEAATSSENGGIVAPVREMAGQVLAVAFWASPEHIKKSAFSCLVTLLKYHREDNQSWEIRHAALVALKYIFAIRSLRCESGSWGNQLIYHVQDVATVHMNDANDDTRGVAAQLLVMLISKQKERSPSPKVDPRIIKSLWKSLSPKIHISSSAKNLLNLLACLIDTDFAQVVSCLSTLPCIENACSSMLAKLEILLTTPYLSVKIQVVQVIDKFLFGLKAYLAESRSTLDDQHQDEIEKSYARVAWEVFCIQFQGEIKSEVDRREAEVFVLTCRKTWTTIAMCQSCIFRKCDSVFDFHRKILFAYFGFPVKGLSIPILGDPDLLSEASFGRHHRSLCDASNSVSLLFSGFEPFQMKKSHRLLHLLFQLCTSFPLVSLFERGCLLYSGLVHIQQKNSIRTMLCSSRDLFLSALTEGGIKCTLVDKRKIRCDASTVRTILGASIQSDVERSFNGAEETIDNVASRLVSLCEELSAKYVQDSRRGDPSLDSMRLGVLNVQSLLVAGVEGIPMKLTPLVRALMTSIKNETDNECRRTATSSMVELLKILFERNTFSEDRLLSFEKARGKILQNLCSIVKYRSIPGYVAASAALAGVIESDETPIDSLGEVWEEINILQNSDIAMDDDKVSEAVIVLNSLCSDPSCLKNKDFLIKAFGHPMVILACGSTNENTRTLASECLLQLANCSRRTVLEKALPQTAQMCMSMDDTIRIRACFLLSQLIDGSAMHLCPFVRSLLPLAMRLMTDISSQCSKTGARVFSVLVRLAPLVKDSLDLPLLPGNGVEKSEKVMDHLIRGLPLPRCELHPIVCAALEDSGTRLRGYQFDGVSWLRFLQDVGLNGALTDSMGLGKTLQALVGISLAHFDGEAESSSAISLVVCPSSVLGHWENESTRFFPRNTVFRPYCFHGTNRNQAIPESCNLVITSYSVLRTEINKLCRKKWTYVVLDEGHLLKNPATATARAARRLESRFKLILTGTPVQNHVHDVWATFDFLMPNFLGSSAEFSRKFARPISKGQAPGASAVEIAVSIEKLKFLHQQVLPFILRREKETVLKELPAKVISVIPCEMSDLQRRLYRSFCSGTQGRSFLGAFQRVLEEPTACSELPSFGRDVLKGLLYLRLVCTHPILVDTNANSSNYGGSNVAKSGKLVALKDILTQCGLICADVTGADNDASLLYISAEANDEALSDEFNDVLDPSSEDDPSMFGGGQSAANCKCLVFAQFTHSLDVVEEFLRCHFPTISYLRLDGRVPATRRGVIVDSFNGDDQVKILLLTTRIGGLGLNLTGADTVIFLEHDWNPHADIQAMDRAHRIGQEKTVNVYKLVTKDSIEETIMQLHETKLAMSRAIVNTENSTLHSMGTDQLLDIFSFRSEQSGSTPKDDFETQMLDTLVERYEDEYANLSLADFIDGFKNGK